jgi:hypothetical protein
MYWKIGGKNQMYLQIRFVTKQSYSLCLDSVSFVLFGVQAKATAREPWNIQGSTMMSIIAKVPGMFRPLNVMAAWFSSI